MGVKIRTGPAAESESKDLDMTRTVVRCPPPGDERKKPTVEFDVMRIVIGVAVLFPLALAIPLWEEFAPEAMQPRGPPTPYSFQVSVSIVADRLVLEPNATFTPDQQRDIFRQTLEGAERGDPILVWRVGFSFYNGFGTPSDEVQAVDWWERAAAKNMKWAHFAMGWVHQYGGGGRKRDPAQALKCYQAAGRADPYFRDVLAEKLRKGELAER